MNKLGANGEMKGDGLLTLKRLGQAGWAGWRSENQGV
jgi:hypothetical protein